MRHKDKDQHALPSTSDWQLREFVAGTLSLNYLGIAFVVEDFVELMKQDVIVDKELT